MSQASVSGTGKESGAISCSPGGADAGQGFVIRSATRTLSARGVSAVLPSGNAATLGERVQHFFNTVEQGPGLLIGALPFDPCNKDHLVQPVSVSTAAMAAVTSGSQDSRARWQVFPEPSAAEYSAMVVRALERIQASAEGSDGLSKVVLARRLRVECSQPLDSHRIVMEMARDPAVSAFVVPLPDRAGRQRMLIGATPELLLAKSGERVSSNPLAGSAKRLQDATLDRAAAEALLASEKDQREHAVVVESIMDILAPHCTQLKTPGGTQLQATASMWHLGTRIEGKLRNAEVSSVELASLLHPTPAVAGTPREQALALIRELEPFDRDFYAGAVGWTDEQGDGEWHISLRCGEVSGSRILLYAGAGIVAGSDPVAEAEETSAKFLALLRALGIDEQGRVLQQGS